MSEKKSMNYAEIAMQMLDTMKKNISDFKYYRGQLYVFNGRYYERIEEPSLKVKSWLILQGRPSSAIVCNNVADSLKAMTMLNNNLISPFWVKGAEREGQPPVEQVGQLIPFTNGLFDVQERRMDKAHDARFFSTYCLPFKYELTATYGRWQEFLDEVIPEKKLQMCLQEYFGYCMTPDNSYQKVMVLCGPPRAGKGTILRVLCAIVGIENYVGFQLRSFAERFGYGRLVDKLLATVGEADLTGCREKHLIMERWNSVVGCDPVGIEYKGKNEIYNAILTCRFLVNCNQMPRVLDPSGAFNARLLVIKFKKSFAEGKEDVKLLEKLLREKSGIINWALEGLYRLHEQQGFTISEKQQKEREENRRDTSNAYAFLVDNCIIDSAINPGNLDKCQFAENDGSLNCLAEDLRDRFSKWNQTEKADFDWMIRDIKGMIEDIETDPYVRFTDKWGVERKTTRYYGIKLKPF